MVRINGLACPAAAVSTSRSLRVVRTFLSNMLSMRTPSSRVGPQPQGVQGPGGLLESSTERHGGRSETCKNPTRSQAAARAHKVAIASIALNLGPLNYTFAVRTQRARERIAAALQCGWQHCGASPPPPPRRRQPRPRQEQPRQERTTTAKTPGSSSSARRGTSRTTGTPGTHWP